MAGFADTQNTLVESVAQDHAVISTTRREKIDAIEQALLDLPQVECPIRHFFTDGLFAREITIYAGTVLTGAEHRTEHIAVLSKGKIRMLRENGTEDISAPYTFIAKPGGKNAGVALEDSIWTSFYPNPDNEQSIDVLAERHTTSKSSELLGGAENKQLISNNFSIVKKIEGE